MATPTPELVSKLQDRHGKSFVDPRADKPGLLPPPRPAHEAFFPAAAEAAVKSRAELLPTAPRTLVQAPKQQGPTTDVTAAITVDLQPAAASPSAAAGMKEGAAPVWVDALHVLKLEQYETGLFSVLSSYQPSIATGVAGAATCLMATEAVAKTFGVPAGSVLFRLAAPPKGSPTGAVDAAPTPLVATVAALKPATAIRCRATPGLLLLAPTGRTALAVALGQGAAAESAEAVAAGSPASSSGLRLEDLPKLSAADFCLLWGAPTPDSEPLTTLSAEAAREAEKAARLAQVAAEEDAQRQAAAVAATQAQLRGEAGVFSGDVFKKRRELFQKAEGSVPVVGATGRPSIGAGAARPTAAGPGVVTRVETAAAAASTVETAISAVAAAPVPAAEDAAAAPIPTQQGVVSSLLSLVGLGSTSAAPVVEAGSGKAAAHSATSPSKPA